MFIRYLFIILLLYISISGQTVTINYDNFNDISELQLNRDAKQHLLASGNNCIRLTESPLLQRAGSFFSKKAISLSDAQGFNASFSASFSFKISDPHNTGADGIVFMIQTVSNSVGSNGEGIGFQGIPRSLGIEFDTYENGHLGDPDDNHIGIDLNGNVRSVKTYSPPDQFESGDIYYAWVDYNGHTDILEIRLSKSNKYPKQPVLTHTIDLTQIFQVSDAFVGFSSATGQSSNNHDILSFHFINKYKPFNLIDDQTFSIPEIATDGDFVGKIKTDTSVKDSIFLNPLNLPSEFLLDKKTREITVSPSANFDISVKDSYPFDLEAFVIDSISPSVIDTIRDTAKITINITEVITDIVKSQTFTVPETTSIGTIIGDIKLNSKVSEPITVIPLKSFQDFNYDDSNREISVKNKLDYDKKKTYTVPVEASYFKQFTTSILDTIRDTATITINIERVILAQPSHSVYEDKNGDGSIDFAQIFLTEEPSELPDEVDFFSPFDKKEKRTIKKELMKLSGKLITIPINPPFSFSGSTYFKKEKFGEFRGGDVQEGVFTISDSVAPVIVSASFHPSGLQEKQFDTLNVTFSEDVKRDKGKTSPFKFINNQGKEFKMVLEELSRKDENYSFKVNSIDNGFYPLPQGSDSIWINTIENITDQFKTTQQVKDNRKVKLLTLKKEFSFDIKALNPFTPGKTDISKVEGNTVFKTGTTALVAFNANVEKFITQSDVQLFDPMGNLIAQSDDSNLFTKLVTIDNKTELRIFWNGKNQQSRYVGMNPYKGTITVEINGEKKQGTFVWGTQNK